MDEAQGWQPGRHTGREAFRAAVYGALRQAVAESWPWMAWSDPDFKAWPLHEAALVDALHQWCLAGGRLRMLASDFSEIQSHCPRLQVWRRQWDHRLEARASGRARREVTPSLLLTPSAALWLAPADAPVCVMTEDAAQRAQWQQDYESLWQTSTAAFPATTLGL